MDASSASPMTTLAAITMIHTGANDRYASNITPDNTAPTAAPNSSNAVTMPVTVPRSFLPYSFTTMMGGATVPMHVANPKNRQARIGPQSVAGNSSMTPAKTDVIVPRMVPMRMPQRS